MSKTHPLRDGNVCRKSEARRRKEKHLGDKHYEFLKVIRW